MRRVAEAREFIRSPEDCAGDVIHGAARRKRRQYRPQAIKTELLLFRIFRFEDSIRGKNNHIADAEMQSRRRVINFWKESERNSVHRNLGKLAAAQEERMRAAGVRHGKCPLDRIINAERQRNKTRL